MIRDIRSPPSRWSGLKSEKDSQIGTTYDVSTLAVEWIEMSVYLRLDMPGRKVSTLAVEWIEILPVYP